jgi:hypothetical protein
MRRAILCVTLALASSPAAAQIPAFDHVFIIVLENKEYSDIIGNPDAAYLNSLASRYGLATNYDGITHPSLPNYMAMTGGDTFFTDNCVSCRTNAVNIVDRLEAAGRTWTAYMEDMTASCGANDTGLYTARHNPFVHYSNIESNPARCAKVVPFTRFSSDLSSGQLANYVWITPNLCSDMHDCSIATGDAWLAGVVPQILQSPAFANGVLFITWDEGTSAIGGGGRTPLIVASRWTAAGTQVAVSANHYSLLRTIEDAWQLPPLGKSVNAQALAGFFTPPPASAGEQVVYAADVTVTAGAWTKVADSTAAGGIKLSNRDAGGAPVASPAALPSNYFEASFDAVAGTRYRVWLRMHAIDDSKFNDSVFVQFDDSVDGSGSAVNRIGSTSGYIVNLWTCATCQSVGWGWQRNAYWLPDTGDVWFTWSGRHSIRVQTREDGVEIDQIVISPIKYANDAPGPVSADHTIVPKPGGDPPPPPPPTSLPSPWSSADVGSTGRPGNASFASGTFTVDGAGADIWGTEDAFQFVSQPATSESTITARVTSLQHTHPYAKAGVMLRQSTTAGSAHVLLNLRPDGNVELLSRASNGAATSFVAGSAAAFPRWLRLARSGDSITASISQDGGAWTTVGSITVSFAGGLAGLAVTSHDAAVTTKATFDTVSVTASSAPPPSPNAGTIVIYASDIPAASRHGSWSSAVDSASPNGVRLETTDAGVANTNNPLASPIDYVDVTFSANSGTPYTLWLRLRATGNSKLNDSLWVQLSDARANGAPVFPLNSTAGLLVNLATDANASSLNAWGWQNGAYWLTQSTTVTFASNGTHTLRLQVREDGVAFDQIVLSPDRYLSTSPGGPTGDRTIVPK